MLGSSFLTSPCDSANHHARKKTRIVMASAAELIVAKTTLSGALFRPDPRPCSRDDIESLLALLNSTVAECSPSNVQVC